MVAPKSMDLVLERFRTELTGNRRRIVGSGFAAEDTVPAARRAGADFDPARGSLLTWLFSIATNVSVDVPRRTGAGDLAPALVAVRRKSVHLAFMTGVHIGPVRPDLDQTQRNPLARYRADRAGYTGFALSYRM